MKIGKLNFGGMFGGVVCGAAAAAIVYLLSHGFPLRAIKVIALAGFAGAALGNWIWGLAAPAEEPSLLGVMPGREEHKNT
jgi:hypothetical protein